jgi:hypothetical protein
VVARALVRAVLVSTVWKAVQEDEGQEVVADEVEEDAAVAATAGEERSGDRKEKSAAGVPMTMALRESLSCLGCGVDDQQSRQHRGGYRLQRVAVSEACCKVGLLPRSLA